MIAAKVRVIGGDCENHWRRNGGEYRGTLYPLANKRGCIHPNTHTHTDWGGGDEKLFNLGFWACTRYFASLTFTFENQKV